MTFLVFNAGSSSLKFSGLEQETLRELFSGLVDWKISGGQAQVVFQKEDGANSRHQAALPDYTTAVGHVLKLLPATTNITGCGHRVVHGGTRFQQSVLIDDWVKEAIAGLADLAPLHNPPALETIQAVAGALPGIPQIAVFDTAFFASLPARSFIYPVPYEWFTKWGIRRFGFHGISHQYCALRAAELLGKENPCLVICHLGNGCSASAVREGQAVATSMGFTPLEGLMMGTRSGSLDPGILLYLLKQKKMSVADLEEALLRQSGLLGITGMSSDMRVVQEAADQGHGRARLALEIFADRVRAAIGGLGVTLGRVDAVVFTAGIGEHATKLRGEICRGLECLGLEIDEERNKNCLADADIAMKDSRGRILVLHTREEYLIGREVGRLIAGCKINS
jgi:acetate kinase